MLRERARDTHDDGQVHARAAGGDDPTQTGGPEFEIAEHALAELSLVSRSNEREQLGSTARIGIGLRPSTRARHEAD
jgi:hypothetical protein